MSTEGRLRAATRARADLVRGIRPLELPEELPSRSGRFRPARPPHRSGRWLSWGAPLAAAAVVALVAVLLAVVRQAPAPPSGPSVSAVPPYYAVIDNPTGSPTAAEPLIVGDDRTGKVIATIAPPAGRRFTVVRAGGDDRTFVVAAGAQASQPPDSWYVLRLTPGAVHPYQLTKLAIALPASTPDPVSVALSPDGRELAIEAFSGSRKGVTTVALYSVASGAKVRVWTTPTYILSGLGGSPLTYTADGQHLVFGVGRFTTGQASSIQLRALDVAGSGTDLLAASRVLLTVNNTGADTCLSLQVTPDGQAAVCATQYAFLTGPSPSAVCGKGELGFTAYSLASGAITRRLYEYRGTCHNGVSSLLWTDASAATIIGLIRTDLANEGGHEAVRIGVITGGHLTPLKISPSVSWQNYNAMAF